MAKRRGFYLLDECPVEILGSKLPSNEQVLSVFLYHHVNLKKSLSESAIDVTTQIQAYWKKARIPTQRGDKIKEKVLQLFQRWKSLKKNQGRTTQKQKENEAFFTAEMKNLFDVAHADALQLIKIEEDKQFLLAQREPGRRGCMGPVHTSLARTEAKSLARKEAYMMRREKQELEAKATTSQVELESSSAPSSTSSDSDDSPEDSTSRPSRKKQARPENVWTPALTAALDRTRTTDRNALFVVTETARSLGHNPSELNISRSSVKRHREKHRQEQWKALQEAFKEDGKTCVVHWDGKLLPSLLDSTETVDRLPVLVTAISSGETQFLGVPKLASGTGANQAAAVYELLQEWSLVDKVAGFCFDTTASNTGRRSGACILLEQHLGRAVLNFACRHHIYEVVLGAVFSTCAGSSSGPDIQLFRRFQKRWNSLKKSDHQTGWGLAELRPVLENDRDGILEFAQSKLKESIYRDDYREFLELAIIFLGGTVPNFSFKKPGSFHHARWMAKILYCLKIWMFRGQLLDLTKREERCVGDVSIFAVLVYLKPWFSATDAAVAPRIDLHTIKQLRSYYDTKIGKVAAGKLENHLWYLSEELVGLSLFDDDVPIATKQAMVLAMEEQKDGEEEEDAPKRIQLKSSDLPSLESLATAKSKDLFRHLDIDSGFLLLKPNDWENDEGFFTAKKRVNNIPVVNDLAERGVALIEHFNGLHTTKDDQLQYLLGVVAEHRKKFPSTSKALLTTGQQ